uniref:multiubiquitin domain-containing protein n=1 Tax=Methylomonas sp. SPW-1 TaxID=3438877 RepID=UPI00402B3540
MKPNHTSVVRFAADETLVFRDLEVPFATPTGAQILDAASVSQKDALLLQRLPSGDLESIRLTEKPDLHASIEFILSFGDRTYTLYINEAQLVWVARHISGATLRKLSNVPDSFDLFQIRNEGEPQLVQPDTVVDLNRPGVEKFITRPKTWKLRVQAVTLEYEIQHVKVSDAMKRAGFDPTKAWDIYLLVADQPKQKVDVDYLIDLAMPGIERIRLMQRNVDNGEASAPPLRREFNLLAVDVAHLDATGWKWEAIKCQDSRWVLIHNYSMLSGYQPANVKLAMLIPKDYPQAQIDMFYFYPFVTRCDGREIPNTQIRAVIDEVQYQGWSRHRNAVQPWDPLTDNVATHLALVESSLVREFGE